MSERDVSVRKIAEFPFSTPGCNPGLRRAVWRPARARPVVSRLNLRNLRKKRASSPPLAYTFVASTSLSSSYFSNRYNRPSRAHSVRVPLLLSHGRVPRCSSPRQRSDISRGARGRDETWHVRPERRQVALLNHEQSPWRGKSSKAGVSGFSGCTAGKWAQGAQTLDFALEPKGSPCTRALGWPGWSPEGKQSMLTVARLTVALLPTNMLRGMLHGEGDKPASATSAAARHARLRCEEHARLRGGAREAHVPCACSTYAFACQYRASTPPVHVHTRRACSASASLKLPLSPPSQSPASPGPR